MKKPVTILAAILFASLVLTSCGGTKLNREKAKQLIIQNYHFPTPVKENCNRGLVCISGNYEARTIFERILVQHKLIIFTNKGKKTVEGWAPWDCFYVELTPEGQKYKINEFTDVNGYTKYTMKVADKVFGEITGIREINNDGKAAEVNYTWKYANITPFGTAITLYHQQLTDVREPLYQEGMSFNEKVMMVKYDDGWRIQ